MKIAKMMRSIDGLEIATEVRGVVQDSMMIVQDELDDRDRPHATLQLTVKDVTCEINATCLPRIDIGEEVILHLDVHENIMGVQIVRGENAIFRMQVQYYKSCRVQGEPPSYEEYSYRFSDE